MPLAKNIFFVLTSLMFVFSVAKADKPLTSEDFSQPSDFTLNQLNQPAIDKLQEQNAKAVKECIAQNAKAKVDESYEACPNLEQLTAAACDCVPCAKKYGIQCDRTATGFTAILLDLKSSNRESTAAPGKDSK